MKYLVLLVLLLATRGGLRAEPIAPLLTKAAVDSLYRMLRQQPADTERVNALLALSEDLIEQKVELATSLGSAYPYARQARQLSQALHFSAGYIRSLYALGRILNLDSGQATGNGLLRQALHLSQRVHHKPLEAIGWCYLGSAYPRTEQELPQVLRCYQQSMALYRQLGDQAKEAYMLKGVADVHLVQGHYAQSLRELLAVLALYRAAGHTRLLYTYDLLVAVNKQMGNYQEAIHYGLASIENARAVHDTAAIALFYARLAGDYRDLGQPAKALPYYQKALAVYQREGGDWYAIRIAGEIARLLIARHQPAEALAFFQATTRRYAALRPDLRVVTNLFLAECYTALKQYDRAETYYQQTLRDLPADAQREYVKLEVYYDIGRFYLLTKQYDKADDYLTQTLRLYARSGSLVGTSNTHLQLFKLDSARGSLTAAIAHYQQYKRLQDSIFNDTKARQIANLEIQYDTRKKEQNIALLTKQNLVQQARLRQREFQRNAFVAGAGLLLLLLGVSYNRYRLKQRSNRLLEAKQAEINEQNHSLVRVLGEKEGLLEEKEWMLKEIHHRVKNNLQVISSLLSSQARYLHEPAALAAMRESQNRVQAIALIHQKLYQSEELARVRMRDYVREIVDQLLDSFDCRDQVQRQLHLAAVELEVGLATSLGLILNEAVTNSLKHAFLKRQRGTITISLTSRGEQRYELLVADNGAGWPPGFQPDDSPTLGLGLMRGLSKQLNGELTFAQASGAQIRLQFEAVRKFQGPLQPESA